jgi:hypothetical protein
MKLCPGRLQEGFDDTLEKTMVKLFNSPKSLAPKVIIETGTYLGLGTTSALIRAVKASNRWKRENKNIPIHTIEANENNYKKATENLSRYSSWVHIHHGLSLGLEECLTFIENDDVLLNHEKYPDIYYDSPDPVKFYSDEVRGQLAFFGRGEQGPDEIIYGLVFDYKKKNPLFCLDSAGGVGFLEYQRVVSMMDESLFYMWLHDTDHLKHFRSLEHMKNCDDCTILASYGDEWVLAAFNLWRCKDVSPMLPKVPKMADITITSKGRTHTIAEWAALLGVKKSEIYRRKKSGWKDNKIIEVPF